MALKQLSKQLVLYFILGGLLTCAEWAGFWVLVYVCGVHYLIANVLLFVIFVPLGMIVFKKGVFKHTRLSARAELALSFMINLLGLLVNSLILWILVEFVGFESLLAKILTSFLVAFYSFFARKVLIYGEKGGESVYKITNLLIISLKFAKASPPQFARS